LLEINSFGSKETNADIRAGANSYEAYFLNLMNEHFTSLIKVTDSMGAANILFLGDGFHIRFCKHLCDFNLCFTTGTRVDPDGAVHSCMNSRGRYYLNVERDLEFNMGMIESAVRYGCGRNRI
jgi:hypothetical protein